MQLLQLFTLFCTIVLSSSPVVAGPPIVALDYGVFQGAIDGNISTFRGVPFAQPAIRFSLPQAPTLLDGVQNATAFGLACPQQAETPPFPFPPLTVPPMSEDCLTLNVFVPNSATPASKLPVLVWIFGGGFEIGEASDTDVGPLVERSIVNGEPVIVVTPNYRLSAYGFLAGKEVGDAGISNLGLRDQIFALEWVHSHIEAFGGDPTRVVLGGASAGAISSAILLMSNKRFDPSALIRGAFLVSGSPITTGSLADGQADYDGLVSVNNCTDAQDTLDCLRRVPFAAFKGTVDKTRNALSYSSLENTWRPRVDGDVVARNPLVSVAKGLYAKLPILSGDCDDEGTQFSFVNDNITTDDEFVSYINSNYLSKATPDQIAELALLYPDDPAQGSPFDTGLANQLTPQFKRLAAFQGDYFFTGTRRFFLQHASRTQNIWSWLSKRGKSTPYLGANHGSDGPIWFPTNATEPDGFLGADKLLNFINHLDPNSGLGGAQNTSEIYWPRWNETSENGTTGSLLTFSDPNAVGITPETFRVDAMEYLFGLMLSEAKDAE
ncbi:carotenoid ester lipase precursor [Mycena polygramma]|nr:carotenoid ester lipase precursor [Mycena polygramma]